MTDYVTGLRRDLIKAAERQQRSGRAARVTRPLRPRAPSVLAGAAAVAVALVAVVVVLATLAPPPQRSAKIVAAVQLGGQPVDTVLAGGSLWVADFEGRLLRLDPLTRRVRARIPVNGEPAALAADGNVLWLRSHDSAPPGSTRSHLLKLDARTGRKLARVPVNGFAGMIAAGAGGLWLIPDTRRRGLERIDPDSFDRTAFVPLVEPEAVSVSGSAVWTRDRNGVVEIDGRTGRVVSRVRGISPALQSAGQRTLLADPEGAWVVSQTDGSVYRVEGGRVTRRIALGVTAGVIARVRSAVWVSASRQQEGGYEIVRIDPDSGKVLQRIDFGFRAPRTLVPVGNDLWAFTTTGEVKVVSPGS